MPSKDEQHKPLTWKGRIVTWKGQILTWPGGAAQAGSTGGSS